MNLSTLADELGALEQELKPLKAKIARAEAIRRAIRYEYAESPAASEHVVTGECFIVNVGACGNVTVVDKPKLLKRVTTEKYIDITVPTLKAIEEWCGQSVLAECTRLVQAGPRALTIIERVTPPAVEAKKTNTRAKKAA